MNHTTTCSRIVLSILSIIIVLFLSCFLDEPTNPFIDGFKGDYRFTVQWQALHTADTLSVFCPYRVPFKVVGKDRFASFAVTDSAGVSLSGNEGFSVSNDDTVMTVYFSRAYCGTVCVHGITPNNKHIIQKSQQPVVVVNPWQVMVDTLMGINSSNRAAIVPWFGTASDTGSMRSVWTIGSTADTIDGMEKSFMTGTENFVLGAALLDPHSNLLPLGCVAITVEGSAPLIDTVLLPETLCLGKQPRFILKLSDKDKNRFRVSAALEKTELFPTPVLHAYDTLLSVQSSQEVTDTGLVDLRICVIDETGLRSNTVILSPRINYTLPRPRFASAAQTIAANKTTSLHIFDHTDSPGTRYRWQLLRKGIDTTTTAESLSVTCQNPGIDTVLVTGINRYGHCGPTDTLQLTIAVFEYTLHPSTFPSVILTHQPAEFIVAVRDKHDEPVTDNVTYLWNIENEPQLESVFKDNNRLRLTAGFETKPFSVSVTALVNNQDSTNTLISLVDVHGRPVCTFTKDSYRIQVGDTARFEVHVENGRSADSVYIQFDTAVVACGTQTSCTRIFTVPDTFTACTWAVNLQGLVSDTDTAVVTVYSNPPSFDPGNGDTVVFVNDTVTVRVNARPGNPLAHISSYFWDTNNDGQWDDTTTIAYKRICAAAPGIDTIRVNCSNTFGDTAAVPFYYYLQVSDGCPVIETAAVDSNEAYIHDTLLLHLRIVDKNGTVTSLHIDTTSDSVSDIALTGLDSSVITAVIPLTFAYPGIYTITLWAYDQENNRSRLHSLPQPITIDAGIPTVTGITPDSVYIRDAVVYTVAAHDNQHISDYSWSLDGTDFTSLGTTPVFTHTFADSGIHVLYARVVDNDGNESAVRTETVYVRYGSPVVDSMTPRSAWINDQDPYTFYFHDPNGEVQSMSIAWGDGSGTQTLHTISGSSASISHAWPVSADTSYTVTVSVTDDDTLSASKSFTVSVREGAPAIQILRIDTTGNNLFVNDMRRYRLRASDPNGTVQKVCAVWHSSSSTPQILTISAGAASIDTFFTHAYAVDQAGEVRPRFWSVDNDGVPSQQKDTLITVRLAPPKLTGDSGDTLWVVIDSVTGTTYTIEVHAADTNGTILCYYWQETPSFDSSVSSCVKTDINSRERVFSQNDMHAPIKMWIKACDDDGVVGGKQFVIYADSVPPAPSVTHSVGTQKVKISWSGKDTKDKDNTQYQVVVKYGTAISPGDENNPDYIASAFRPGTEYESGGPEDDFSFTYTPSNGSGKYYYLVIARDARGSISKDNGEHSFNF